MATTQARHVGDDHQAVEIRRILCPVDFSEFSRGAAEVAAGLASACRADITALFVFPLDPAPAGDASRGTVIPDEGARSVVAGDLQAFFQPAGDAGIPIKVGMRAGDPAREILEQAGVAGADLIVMGTHGRSGFERWVLGSVADKVLRKATCSVVIVPHAEDTPSASKGVRPKSILCALDLSESSTRTAEYVLSVARAVDARVTLLHVVEGAPDPTAEDPYGIRVAQARSGLEGVAREARDRCRIEELVVPGRPYREILRLAEERSAGLIAIGTHGATPIDRMFFGSTADQVVRGARCPVLVVR